MINFIEVLLTGVTVGGVYALLALGFVIIFKSSKVFNFAVGQLLTWGAYIFMIFIVNLKFPIWIGFLATIGFAVLVGFSIERLLLRPMIGQSILSIIMMTLAISVFLSGFIVLIWGGTWYAYPSFLGSGAFKIGEITLSVQHVVSLGIALLLFGILSLYFKFTFGGLAMRAVAEDHQVARSKGVNAKQVFAHAWVICAVVCVISGILLGSMLGVGPGLAIMGLKAVPVVLVGGLESIPGVLIAGPLIGIIEALVAEYISPGMGMALEEIIPYIILVLILIFKPYGLFGIKRIERI